MEGKYIKYPEIVFILGILYMFFDSYPCFPSNLSFRYSLQYEKPLQRTW